MNKDISKSIKIYKEQLAEGYIRKAYIILTKYISELRTKFSKEYEIGNIAFGYLDFTYFYFTNEYFKSRKLKLGLVLNHSLTQVELWLLGQTKDVQYEYWHILKNTKWNNKDAMPKYSILEVCLEYNIDFNNKEKMTVSILDNAVKLSKEIQSYL